MKRAAQLSIRNISRAPSPRERNTKTEPESTWRYPSAYIRKWFKYGCCSGCHNWRQIMHKIQISNIKLVQNVCLHYRWGQSRFYELWARPQLYVCLSATRNYIFIQTFIFVYAGWLAEWQKLAGIFPCSLQWYRKSIRLNNFASDCWSMEFKWLDNLVACVLSCDKDHFGQKWVNDYVLLFCTNPTRCFKTI